MLQIKMLKQFMKIEHITFSSAQDPSEGTSVYGSPENLALAMFQCSAPTLLAYGGTYAHVTDIPIENILPFAFPFGIGGPKMN
jgi:hypothetical protein